jgi:hypothetical protein
VVKIAQPETGYAADVIAFFLMRNKKMTFKRCIVVLCHHSRHVNTVEVGCEGKLAAGTLCRFHSRKDSLWHGSAFFSYP